MESADRDAAFHQNRKHAFAGESYLSVRHRSISWQSHSSAHNDVRDSLLSTVKDTPLCIRCYGNAVACQLVEKEREAMRPMGASSNGSDLVVE